VVFDADGGGDGGAGLDGGGGGNGETRYHTLGGPSKDDVPSSRAYDANHADAPRNIYCMFVTELVFHPEMSALKDEASSNIRTMFVTELVFHPEMSTLNADAL